MTSTPKHIFGIHEFGGEQHILDAGRTGWIVDTVALKDNPFGKDWSGWDNRGLGILCRINWGYEPDGTIPHSRDYDAFAEQCAQFVRRSVGCNRWIVGNEMNVDWERPGGRENGEVITPALYIECYAKVRRAIKAVQPDAEVIIGAVAPWNVQTKYVGNESGNWMNYYWSIVTGVGTQCDGISIHAYTHQHDPNLIYSDVKMESHPEYRYEFRAYQDFMTLIPAQLMHVPVYITETDADVPWKDENNGWIRAAYGEINWWNEQPGHQQIRALCLYRWPKIDKWYIEGKDGLIEDFKGALQQDYQWMPTRANGYKPAEIVTIPTPPDPELVIVQPVPAGPAKGIKVVQVRLNVRRTIGYRNKEVGDVVAVLNPGARVEVHDGPVPKDGLEWLQIAAEGAKGLAPDTRFRGQAWAAVRAPSGVDLLLDEADGDLLSDLAHEHAVDEELVRAVLAVESGGSGFRKGRLLVRFEPGVYANLSRLPQAVFDMYFQKGKSYNLDMYRSLPSEEFSLFHGNQDLEWHALEVACRINQTAGWKSASYGGPQIMGFNAEKCGYDDVYAMVEAFKTGGDEHLRAMFRLLPHLRTEVDNGKRSAMDCLREKDLWGFVRRYNGSGQEEKYGCLLSNVTGIELVIGGID